VAGEVLFTGVEQCAGHAQLSSQDQSRAVAGADQRFHQTLKKWLTHQSPAQTITQLQVQLDTFRADYNTVR
jgi:hypothetical protein